MCLELVSFVEKGQVQGASLNESFSEPYQNSRVLQFAAMNWWCITCGVVSTVATPTSELDLQCRDSPEDQSGPQLQVGSDFPQEQTGWQFKDEVANIEKREVGAQLRSSHLELLLQSSGIGISQHRPGPVTLLAC